MTGTQPASRRAAPRSSLPLTVLSLLALLSLLATLPLSLLSGQLGYGTVAVVIGIPCAAVGVVVAHPVRIDASPTPASRWRCRTGARRRT